MFVTRFKILLLLKISKLWRICSLARERRADMEKQTKQVHLPNSDSEFTLVIGDQSKLSNDFGLKCISTIDQLNNRIANVSTNHLPDTEEDDILHHESEKDNNPTEKSEKTDESKYPALPRRGNYYAGNMIDKNSTAIQVVLHNS